MYAVKPTQARSRLAEVVLPSGVDSEPQRKLSLPNLAGPDKNAVKLVGNKGRSSCVIVATEDTRLLEEYTEGNVKLQNIIEEDLESGVVMCIRFSPDGQLLAAGFSNGLINVYSVDDCRCLYSLGRDEERVSVTCIRFYPTNSYETNHLLVATYTSGHLRYWHYTSGTSLATIDEVRRYQNTSSVAFNVPGDRIVTVGADPQVFVYDSETRKRINMLEPTDCTDKMDGHRFRAFAVQFHPTDPNICISGGWDNTVQFWDIRGRHAFRKLYGPHICGDALDIDPTHDHILTGSWRTETPLQIWDFGTGEKIKDVPHDRLYGSLLYCAQWIGKENIACGGSMQNMARLIDRGTLNTVGQLANLPKGVYAMDNDRQDVRPLLAAAAANKIYLLKQVVK